MSTLPQESGGPRWEGELREDTGSEEVVLATTDECIVFRSETGRRGTVPREHVSAVESRVWTEADYEGSDYRLYVGGGAVLSTVAFLGAIVTSSGLVAFLLVLVAVAGLRLADFGWKHRDEFDGIERVEREVEHVTVHADGGVRRRFALPVEYRAGARLDEFVRNARTDGVGGKGQRPGRPAVERVDVPRPSDGGSLAHEDGTRTADPTDRSVAGSSRATSDGDASRGEFGSRGAERGPND